MCPLRIHQSYEAKWVFCMRPNIIENHYLLCVDANEISLWRKDHCTCKRNCSLICLLPSATLPQGPAGTHSTQHMPAAEMELSNGAAQRTFFRGETAMRRETSSSHATKSTFLRGTENMKGFLAWAPCALAQIQLCKKSKKYLIALTFGKISVSWYWYQYSACIYRESWLLQFTILFLCSAKNEVSLWTSEYWSSPPTMHTKKQSFLL